MAAEHAPDDGPAETAAGALFDADADGAADAAPPGGGGRSRRALRAEIRRRRRALQARNPLEDREAYLVSFRQLVALQARLRDAGE